MKFIDKVTNCIDQNNLIDPNDSILIALSGGPDSVALLKSLSLLQKEMRLSLSVIYINHNIRPKAAEEEEKFCQALCARLKIELIIVKEDIPALAKKQKKGLEETGRDFRHSVFSDLAKANGCNKIALGHHADDQVETILFRIIRGTGRLGLIGIKPKRDNIIRPLIDCTKDEILKFLKSKKINYCLDRSNEKNDFKRNYIRNRLIPELKKNLNPKVSQAILNLADNLEEEENLLASMVMKNYCKVVSKTPGGIFEIDLSKFIKLDNWLQRRIFRQILSQFSPDKKTPDKAAVEALICLAESKESSLSLPGRVQAEKAGAALYLFHKKDLGFNLPLEPDSLTNLPLIGLKIKSSVVKRDKIQFIKKKQSTVVFLDYKNIKLPLAVRSIKPGDRFQPLGLKGTKKVGDYLTDKKVPKPIRSEIPVVVDQTGIIWLAGWEIDNRVKIKANSKEVIKIELL